MELNEINLIDVEASITKRVELDDYFDDISFCADPKSYRIKYNESIRGMTSRYEGIGFYEYDGTFVFPEDAVLNLQIFVHCGVVKSANYWVEKYNSGYFYLDIIEETNLKKAVKFIVE